MEESLQVQDVELIKQGKKDNPVLVTSGEKAVKWINCPKYVSCLSFAEKQNAVNWSCLNCRLVKEAHVRDLVIFRAQKSFSKQRNEEVKELEKLWHIKTSKIDHQL